MLMRQRLYRSARLAVSVWLALPLTSTGHEAESVSVATAADPISNEDLLSIADLGISDEAAVSISPDGTAVAVEVRHADWRANKTSIRWLVVPLDGSGTAIDVGDGGEPIASVHAGLSTGYSMPQVARWSADSKWIVYRARKEGQVQLWRSTRDGRVQEKVTRGTEDVGSFFAIDGDQILFAAHRSAADSQGTIREEGLRGYRYDERFALLGSNERRPQLDDSVHVRSHDLRRGAERSATAAEALEYERLAQETDESFQFRRSAIGAGPRAYLQDTRSSTAIGINPSLTVAVSVRQPSSTEVTCTAPVCTGYFKGVWADRTSAVVYGLRWAGSHDYGSMLLFAWNWQTNDVREVLRTDDDLSGCRLAGAALLCGHESPTTPRKLVAVDLNNGALTSLLDPNANLARRSFGEVVTLRWVDPTGIEGFGHLVKPIGYRAGQQYPLIVVQYRSRGFLRGGVGDEYPIHVLAAKGFAVLSFHRPDDSALEAAVRSYEELEQRGWVDLRDRKLVLTSLEAGIETVLATGIANRDRVGITGLSDGSETLAFALIHSSIRFAAASSSGAPWEPISYFVGGPRLSSYFHSMGFEYPTCPAAQKQWQSLALSLNTDKVATPLLLQVPEAELLPATQTYAAFREAGIPVELYVFPEEVHIKTQPAHRMAMYRRNVQWFEFWLKGSMTSEPLDPTQNDRWTSLKRALDQSTKTVQRD